MSKERERVYSDEILGGGGLIPNIGKRIEQEIRQMSPVGAHIRVTTPSDTHEAWRGASAFAASDHFKEYCVTRSSYHECGASRFPMHFAANGSDSL